MFAEITTVEIPYRARGFPFAGLLLQSKPELFPQGHLIAF